MLKTPSIVPVFLNAIRIDNNKTLPVRQTVKPTQRQFLHPLARSSASVKEKDKGSGLRWVMRGRDIKEIGAL
jgi:hypothetical protein